jgi:hypothetical protein
MKCHEDFSLYAASAGGARISAGAVRARWPGTQPWLQELKGTRGPSVAGADGRAQLAVQVGAKSSPRRQGRGPPCTAPPGWVWNWSSPPPLHGPRQLGADPLHPRRSGRRGGAHRAGRPVSPSTRPGERGTPQSRSYGRALPGLDPTPGTYGANHPESRAAGGRPGEESAGTPVPADAVVPVNHRQPRVLLHVERVHRLAVCPQQADASTGGCRKTADAPATAGLRG